MPRQPKFLDGPSGIMTVKAFLKFLKETLILYLIEGYLQTNSAIGWFEAKILQLNKGLI